VRFGCGGRGPRTRREETHPARGRSMSGHVRESVSRFGRLLFLPPIGSFDSAW